MSLDRSTPVVGVTRFSVVKPGGSGLNLVAKNKGDENEYLKQLFNEERMLDRIHIFGKLAAPIYQTFADRYNYVHLVQYSRELPERYRNALFEIAEKYPVVKPVLVTTESIVDSVKKHVLTWDRGFRGVFVWIRVDDDDLLSVDYLDALSRYVSAENVGTAVSFSTLIVGQYSSERLLNFHQANQPKNSIGQAYICWANRITGVIDTPPMYSHAEIDKHLPLILDPTEAHALQVRHAFQDTSNMDSKLGGRISHRAYELGQLPNVNYRYLVRKFPTIENVDSQNTEFSTAVDLQPSRWVECGGELSTGSDEQDQVLEARWDLRFEAGANESASLSFDFSPESLVEGHYTTDKDRGPYRRLYTNSLGSGSSFFVVPKGTRLNRVRLNAEKSPSKVLSGSLRLRQVKHTPRDDINTPLEAR